MTLINTEIPLEVAYFTAIVRNILLAKAYQCEKLNQNSFIDPNHFASLLATTFVSKIWNQLIHKTWFRVKPKSHVYSIIPITYYTQKKKSIIINLSFYNLESIMYYIKPISNLPFNSLFTKNVTTAIKFPSMIMLPLHLFFTLLNLVMLDAFVPLKT